MPPSTTPTHFDACVIGGGPAGTSTAIRLARLSHTVCLVEKAGFPRPHVGEALSPGVWSALRILGLEQSLVDGYSIRVEKTTIRWAESRTEHVVLDRPDQGLLVDRSRFDSSLLKAALVEGVTIFDDTRITSAEMLGCGWCLDLIGARGHQPITAEFLVDAAGRNGFLPGKRNRVSAPTLALCGHLRGDAKLRQTRIEAIPDGWCWGAPFPGGLFSAMVFLDGHAFRKIRSQGIETIWRSCLSGTKLFRRISTSPVLGGVFARDSATYYSVDPIGKSFIRVGEALFGLDPLSSSGVERAMYSGIAAATVMHTLIRRPERYDLCAAYYADRQTECITKHTSWASAYYAEVTRFAERNFWKARSVSMIVSEPVPTTSVSVDSLSAKGAGRMKVRVSEATRLIRMPCVVGNEIEACLALSHPNLDRPVAFLYGIQIARLLEATQRCADFESLLTLWSTQIPRESIPSIAAWFLTRKILELRPI